VGHFNRRVRAPYWVRYRWHRRSETSALGVSELLAVLGCTQAGEPDRNLQLKTFLFNGFVRRTAPISLGGNPDRNILATNARNALRWRGRYNRFIESMPYRRIKQDGEYFLSIENSLILCTEGTPTFWRGKNARAPIGLRMSLRRYATSLSMSPSPRAR